MGVRTEPVGSHGAGETSDGREVPPARRSGRRPRPRRARTPSRGRASCALPPYGLEIREGAAQEQGRGGGLGRVSPPRQVSGGTPGHHPRATTATSVHTSTQADPDHGTAALHVRSTAAQAYPPAGRRSLWLLLVKSCPFCGYAHAHRGGPTGGLREAGCGRGEYAIRPVVAVSAA